jgi:hypothetical protein
MPEPLVLVRHDAASCQRRFGLVPCDLLDAGLNPSTKAVPWKVRIGFSTDRRNLQRASLSVGSCPLSFSSVQIKKPRRCQGFPWDRRGLSYAQSLCRDERTLPTAQCPAAISNVTRVRALPAGLTHRQPVRCREHPSRRRPRREKF